MITDRMLKCRDCHVQFVFSAGEQEFFLKKGLSNEPKRCQNCRILMRAHRSGQDLNGVGEAMCAECGTVTKVPFQPKGHSPVYCLVCFLENRQRRLAAAARPETQLVHTG